MLMDFNQANDEHDSEDMPGKLLLVDLICFSHVLMGALVKTFALNQVVPRCYALNFTFRFPPRYNRLVKLLRDAIDKDLRELGGYTFSFSKCLPPDARQWGAHTLKAP